MAARFIFTPSMRSVETIDALEMLSETRRLSVSLSATKRGSGPG
jgi:hypothetical protein